MTRTAVRHLAPAAVLALLLLCLPAAAPQAQTTYMPGAEPPKHHAAPDTTITIEVQKLAPGVYAAKVEYVWTGWVELPEGILLVDSSLDDKTAEALADTIRARSGPRPVKYVVNTHAHEDHFGGNRYFVSRGATVLAQANAAAKIDSIVALPPSTQDAAASDGRTASPKLVKPSTRIEHKRVLGPASRRVEIVWLGNKAHTAGDLVVYLPKQKVIFAGDLVSNRAVPWMLDTGMNRLGWIAALDSLISKAFVYDKLVPGHGEYAEPWKGLRFTRGYLNDAYEKAAKTASWGTSIASVKEWGYVGPYEDAEFYAEVHFMNMRRLYNEARGIKTPGRPRARAIKR